MLNIMISRYSHMFMTFEFCNELEILLLNTTSHFGFQLTSAICSQKLHTDV